MLPASARRRPKGVLLRGARAAYPAAMLRNILLVLDDTTGAAAARDLALGLARASGAALTAAQIMDPPGAPEAMPAGSGAFAARRDAAQRARQQQEAERVLAEAQAAAGDTPFDLLRLDQAPEPALLRAGIAHDLIVLGRDSTLGREDAEDGLAPAIEALVRDGARPLLVVPPGWHPAPGPVVVGLDASIPAQRSLQLLALLGLAAGNPTTVLAEDEALAEEAAAYLRAHGALAEGFATPEYSPALLLTEARTRHARLLALGVEPRGGLAGLILGSPVARLLRDAPCPVFIHG